jgi:hypothetical protein
MLEDDWHTAPEDEQWEMYDYLRGLVNEAKERGYTTR